MHTDLETARLEFKHHGEQYTLEASPNGNDWSMKLVSPNGLTSWARELVEKQTAELVWKLAQVCQPQQYKDYRTGVVITQTNKEREEAEATLAIIVGGHLDSIAVREALS